MFYYVFSLHNLLWTFLSYEIQCQNVYVYCTIKLQSLLHVLGSPLHQRVLVEKVRERILVSNKLLSKKSNKKTFSIKRILTQNFVFFFIWCHKRIHMKLWGKVSVKQENWTQINYRIEGEGINYFKVKQKEKLHTKISHILTPHITLTSTNHILFDLCWTFPFISTACIHEMIKFIQSEFKIYVNNYSGPEIK